MPSAPPHSLHRRPLLLCSVAVPIALIGSMLGAPPASAAGSTETTKAGLVAAMQSATNGYVLTLGRDLVGDGGTSDVLTVPASRSVRLDLNGHDLDLDRLVLNASSTTFIFDGSGRGARLTLGGSSIAAGDALAGAEARSGSQLEIQTGVGLTAVGSTGRAGIGTVSGSDTNALLFIDDGARVDATGGSHGAGIGGGEGAAPLNTISIGNGTVHATGGAGAAGIGGGVGSTAGSTVSIENGDVTAADGGLASDVSGTPAPSAIGGGQGSPASAFGTLTNTATAGHTSALRIPAGSTLTVPTGQAMSNSGDMVIGGTLTGAGTIDNTGGTIRQAAGGTVDDGQLTVTGRNHAVAFSPAGGSVTAPATKHVYATTFANAGLDLGAYTGSARGKTLVGWRGTQSGTSVARVTNDDLLATLSSSGGESDPVALTAAYETPIAFTGSALRNAAIGQRYEQPSPVTGDATAFSVAENPATGLPAGTIPAFPVGLGLDAGSGVISGRPSEGGRYSFVLTASSAHQRVSHVVAIDIAGAPAFATAALPDGTIGTPYSVPILATSDSGSVTYEVTGGVLPGGLHVDETTGVLAGTPASTGVFTFTIAATNAYGGVDRSLSLTVAAAAAAPAPESGASGGGGISAVPAPPAPDSLTTNAPPTAPPTAPIARPVLPIAPTIVAKLGHPLALSLAASSTVPVTYSVRPKELPAGISLDRSTGLLFGAPRTPGHSVLHLTATSSAGSTWRSYTVVVPAATRLVTGSASAITPRSGTRVTVTIHGLLAGERWRIALNGHQVRTGIARFGGSTKQAVRLPARAKDTQHRIRVSGDRRVTDPATVAHHELTVTAVTAQKRLRLSRSGSALTVRGLAAKERVTVRRGNAVLATGRADAHGVFVVRVAHPLHGVHTVTGSTKHRAGRLVVR